MDTALVAIVGVLAIIALVLGVLWQRARGAAADAARGLAEAAQAHQRERREADERSTSLQAQLSQLQERSRALDAHTWLSDFPADAVFALIARDEADYDGKQRSFGLVRDEAGRIKPFVSERRMGHLQPGDSFVAVRGQLVKLEPDDLEAGQPAASDARAPSPRPAAAAPSRPPPTAMASPPSARVPARDPDATVPAAHDDLPAQETASDRTVFLSPTRDAAPEDPNAGLPYLEVIAGPDLGKSFVLPFSGAGVGRDAGNVVPLGDGGASRVHCRIDYEHTGFVLRDNDSTNGTLCNDEPVREHALAFGDVLQVADTRLRFSCDGHELRASDPPRAAAAFEQCLAHQPDFVLALKGLAFLLERDVARKKDAQPIWDRIARLERAR